MRFKDYRIFPNWDNMLKGLRCEWMNDRNQEQHEYVKAMYKKNKRRRR